MSTPAFELPERLVATEPPEARGLRRDAVRLMVASRGDDRIEHRTFSELPEILRPGDLLVVNRPTTLAAAVPARRPDGTQVQVNVATADTGAGADAGRWIVELRSADGAAPESATPGETLSLPGGASVELLARHAHGRRLWLARIGAGVALHAYLEAHGHPIR